MNQIERSFAKLRGKLCWGVKRGFGSFLTLEFGTPRLVVREPHASTRAVSRRVQKLFARRLVSARGRWHLWIYCCEWRVSTNGIVIGDSSTRRRIDRAARELNGQKLLDVIVNPRGARTCFVFDLGAKLETKPFDRSSEQWLLYEPNGRVLAWRADRKYRYGEGKRPPGQWQWRKLTSKHLLTSDQPCGVCGYETRSKRPPLSPRGSSA
jgi:hypothetical protein